MSSSSNTAVSTSSGWKTKDGSFYAADTDREHVTFLVEDTLFRVPRAPLEEDSEVFRDMYALPVEDESVPDGSDDGHPLRLEGIQKSELRLLLRALYPGMDPRESSPSEWVTILKLADMWHLARVRELAIAALTPTLSAHDPVQQLVLAQRYGVDHWLVPALNALARRPAPLSPRDAAAIGWEWALKLAAVREIFPGQSTQCGCACFACERAHNCSPRKVVRREEYDFSGKIRVEFGLELTPLSGFDMMRVTMCGLSCM